MVAASYLHGIVGSVGPRPPRDVPGPGACRPSSAEIRLSYAPIVQRMQPAVGQRLLPAKVVQNRNPLLGRSDLPAVFFRRSRPAAGTDAALRSAQA